MPPPGAAMPPWAHPGLAPHPAVKKAKDARTWGIIGIVLAFIPYFTVFAIVSAIVALVQGSKAKRDLAPYGVATQAYGHASTAVVLGIVGLCLAPLVIILAAVVFVLVTKLAATAVVLLL